MTDRDPILDDELGARIGTALRRHAERTEPAVPAASTIRAEAHRQDRRRRVQIGAVVMTAAAVFAALILVRTGDEDAAYYEVGPSTTEVVPAPLHLALGAAELRTSSAVESHLTTAGFPPGTTPGPEGRSGFEHIVYGRPGSLDLPRLIVAVRTFTNPTGPWGAPFGNERATTVGGRSAVVRSTSGGAAIVLKWDEYHEVAAVLQGVDEATANAALTTLAQDDTGRWSLGSPPPGLEEIGRARPDEVVPGWYEDKLVYEDAAATADAPFPGLHRLTVSRVDPAFDDEQLLARGLQASQGAAPIIERTTIRGHSALVIVPSADAPIDELTYAWFEPDHDVLVMLEIGTSDRVRADLLLATLREVGPQEWTDLVRGCVIAEQYGTLAPPPPDGVNGGACPR